MKIKVDKLKNIAGIREPLDFSETKAELSDTSLPLAAAPLVFHGCLEHLDRIIKVEGEITCTLAGICDRCGEVTEYPVSASFSEAFTNLTERVSEDEGESETEVHLFTGNTIELLPYIERAVFLTMPMKILCKEDCLGLCPQCGVNRNKNKCSCDNTPIDPRLAVLGDLLREKE